MSGEDGESGDAYIGYSWLSGPFSYVTDDSEVKIENSSKGKFSFRHISKQIK